MEKVCEHCSMIITEEDYIQLTDKTLLTYKCYDEIVAAIKNKEQLIDNDMLQFYDFFLKKIRICVGCNSIICNCKRFFGVEIDGMMFCVICSNQTKQLETGEKSSKSQQKIQVKEENNKKVQKPVEIIVKKPVEIIVKKPVEIVVKKPVIVQEKKEDLQCSGCDEKIDGIDVRVAIKEEGFILCSNCMDETNKLEVAIQKNRDLDEIKVPQVKVNEKQKIKVQKQEQSEKEEEQQENLCSGCGDAFQKNHKSGSKLSIYCYTCQISANLYAKTARFKELQENLSEYESVKNELVQYLGLLGVKPEDANKQPSKLINNVSKLPQYSEKQCKLCFSADSEMINHVCRHVVMCGGCYKNYKKKNENADELKCPVCNTVGEYSKFIAPIFS